MSNQASFDAARDAAINEGAYVDVTGVDRPGSSAEEPDILRAAWGATQRITGELSNGLPTGSKSREILNAATEALRAAARTIEKARNDGRSIANNQDLFYAGREERVQAVIDNASETVARAVQGAETAAEVFKAMLETEIIPAAPKGQDAALATSQIQALMSVAPSDSEGRQAAFQGLATSSDPAIGGLVLGDFGRQYAALAFGPDLGPPLHQAMRLRVIDAALNGSDPRTQALAKTWRQVGKLSALASGMTSAWAEDRQRLSGAVARVKRGLPV